MSDYDCFYGIILKGEGLTLELKGFSQGWLVQLINVKAPGQEGLVYLCLPVMAENDRALPFVADKEFINLSWQR